MTQVDREACQRSVHMGEGILPKWVIIVRLYDRRAANAHNTEPIIILEREFDEPRCNRWIT